jgi:hypothetical protein
MRGVYLVIGLGDRPCPRSMASARRVGGKTDEVITRGVDGARIDVDRRVSPHERRGDAMMILRPSAWGDAENCIG